MAKTSTTTRVRKDTTITVTAADIIKFLMSEKLINHHLEVDKVFVRIPGGGDWSNHDLDIEEGTEITVTLHPTETTE